MDILFAPTPDGSTYLMWMLSGLSWTLLLWILASIIAFPVGIVIGAMRTAPWRAIRLTGKLYVQIFRNIPLLVQVFLWYFIVPELLPIAYGDALKQLPPPWIGVICAIAGLGLYTSARVAEQVRAGVEALSPGQRGACSALGLSVRAMYVHILLPQALRITLPTLTSEMLGLLKNTSVALTIGILEITSRAQQMNEFTFQTFTAFTCATVLYLLLALIVHFMAMLLEKRYSVPGLNLRPTRGH
ncbi:glutamate ABC transporter permease [Pseudomonas agarici]|uniref:Glutamate ABC transporter permease n=1 Tax=Pseudomonas agarici TaxID=46677 RepID=A0A0X1T1K2_PSEAA|nr:amino acid ABC transporter permease [Pseudomonas agarici]AMB85921.1 glutamate ABC transporter permease [Pseudomonas agarici]SEK45290.1 glutamate/aspartate transport system permease protein [Pseudomonas agarici]